MKNPSDSVCLPHYKQISLHVKGMHVDEISMHHCWIGFVRNVMSSDFIFFPIPTLSFSLCNLCFIPVC